MLVLMIVGKLLQCFLKAKNSKIPTIIIGETYQVQTTCLKLPIFDL
jgi:hypothetical protein